MAASWTVTGQQSDQTTFVGGQPVTGHQVSFITGNGWRGTVFVPDDHYTPAKVRQLVQAAANTADEVGALSAGQA